MQASCFLVDDWPWLNLLSLVTIILCWGPVTGASTRLSASFEQEKTGEPPGHELER